MLRHFGEKDENYNHIIIKLIKDVTGKVWITGGTKYLKTMKSSRWTNCDVFCTRFPYFPKAIPFSGKTITKKD